MVKNHLKTIAVPRTWAVKRKSKVWITRPNSGAHSNSNALPLNVVLKDILNIAASTKEVKYILQNHEIWVDQRRRKDKKHGIGLMDTLSLPLLEKNYRVLFNKFGKIKFVEISEAEAKIKPCKIMDKHNIKKKMQLNLSDGRNILVEKADFKTGDSLIIELPSQKIAKSLPLKKGSYIFLIGGQHLGAHGKVEEIQEQHIVFKSGKKLVKTLTKYVLVIGEDKPEITLIKNE